MGNRIGVLLSGCGVYDGTEIHEAVLTLLYLDQKGAEIVCMAPDIFQTHVIDHLTGEIMDERRNVLIESARIARGEIRNLKDINAEDLDALILPGGFGAAKNLSDFAFKGPSGEVNKEVQRLIEDMHEKGKPVGALCIAPATIGLALNGKEPEMTVGTHEETINALRAMGVKHVTCPVDGIVIDKKNMLVTSPAYMLGPGISNVAKGVEKLVDRIMSMIQE